MLRAIFEQSAVGMALTDPKGLFLAVNDRYCEITGRTRDDLLTCRMHDITHPDDLASNLEDFARIVSSGGEFEIEKRYLRPDGSHVWVQNSVTGLVESGELAKVLAVSVDVSDRKASEEHLDLVVHELRHRLKNTMAVVGALARQSFLPDRPVKEALSAYERRLGALSAANELLLKHEWDRVELRDLIAATLDPFDLSRCHTSGERVFLPAKTSVNLAMCLHELATNAEKYGAFSTPEGRVDLRWSIFPEGILELRWQEVGGPPVQKPEKHGFGTRLLTRAMAGELKGKIEIIYEPAGVVCEVRADCGAAPSS